MSAANGLESTRALKALFHIGYCRGSPSNTGMVSFGSCPETNSSLLTVLCSKLASVNSVSYTHLTLPTKRIV